MEHSLADALGDTPETVIACHQLRRGLARCRVAGTLPDVDAAVVQAIADPTEPAAFGRDPEALWRLLRELDGWTCVSLPATLAAPVRQLLERDLGRPARLYGDIHHVLTRPAEVYSHPDVRVLSTDDLPVIADAPEEVRGGNWPTPRAMLEEGCVAGAIVDGHLVAIAQISSLSDRHADVGVTTLTPYRRQGLSSAAASLVARWAQVSGRTPVWSTGEDNHASLRVAQKLGFVAVSRREYVIPSPP